MAKKIEKISQFEVSEEREKEPKEKVVVVYRGENPYMMRLSKRLKEMGYEVDERRISIEAKEEIDKLTSSLIERKQKAALVKKFIGEIPQNVCVVTDKTMEFYVRLLAVDPINAYWEGLKCDEFKSPADIVKYYKPVVDEIRERGKVPVLVQRCLSDHLSSATKGLEESEKNKIIEKAFELGLYPQHLKEIREKKRFRSIVDIPIEDILEFKEAAVLLSTVVNQDLNVPVITEDELYWELGSLDKRKGLQGNVIEILKKRGLNKDQVVLLVDHHVNELAGKTLKKSGFSEVPIVPVCPCCVGKEDDRVKGLKEYGFNVFDLKFEGSNDMFEGVKQAIEKRILDLKKNRRKK
jgi:hypothetical protein